MIEKKHNQPLKVFVFCTYLLFPGYNTIMQLHTMTTKSILSFLLLAISAAYLSDVLRLFSTDLGTALVEQQFLYYLSGPHTCIFVNN